MSALIERIREECERRGWYGPQAEGPAFRRVSIDDPGRSGFIWKPATEQQLRDTTRALGLSLPSLLRTLYQDLANGGFGPGYGLRGVLAGYAPGETILDHYPKREEAVQFIEMTDIGVDWETSQASYLLHWMRWPRQLIPLCNWGCGIEMCVDCTTDAGQVFRLAPPPQDEHWIMTRAASSLEVWLEHWLTEEW